MVTFYRRVLAALKTYVRGIALEGEEPLFQVSPLMVFFATLLGLAFVLATTQFIWNCHFLGVMPLLLPLFILGQSAAWYLYMVEHHAVHDAIALQAWVNSLVAQVASIVGLFIPPAFYAPEHNQEHHNSQKLAYIGDPDYRWLARLGFYPGRSLEEYWRQLWVTLFDPCYYLTFFWKRVYLNFWAAPIAHRFAAFLWWGFVIAATITFHLWAALVMYLLVISVGYQFSALLQTLSEHRWGFNKAPRYKTFPRLLPVDEKPHLFLLFLYWRMTVLVTDLAQHQVHHYKAKNLDWPMVGYSRFARRDLPAAVWGIRAHFNEAFRSLAEATPPDSEA